MEKKQRVFIKGVPGRGDEVKQALINLGGYVVRDYNYTVSDCLYYINHNEEIRCTEKTTEIGKIIMDNYKEIKLSGQWSDGDILVRKDNNNLFCVYQKPADNGKLPEKKNNNKVFELPFAIGDKVWFIRGDKVHEGTVIECNVSINQDGVQIYYSVIYTSKYNGEEEAERIISNRFFKTKKKLLASL